MPIISARGIITPAIYRETSNLQCFYEGRRVRKGWDDKQFTTLVSLTEPEQIPLHLLHLQLLEVAGIQIKIIRMILTRYLYSDITGWFRHLHFFIQSGIRK
jgi:hypothetical protein